VRVTSLRVLTRSRTHNLQPARSSARRELTDSRRAPRRASDVRGARGGEHATPWVRCNGYLLRYLRISYDSNGRESADIHGKFSTKRP